VSVSIIRAGLLTSIQANARVGQRHMGVPSCGAADILSMALANHLVGNNLLAPALELTLTGAELRFEADYYFAITGAPSKCYLSGAEIPFHHTLRGVQGDILRIGPAIAGARVYLGFAAEIQANDFLGSKATYLPGAFGGFKGRALQQGDRLELTARHGAPEELETPPAYRPAITGRSAARASTGPEFGFLSPADGAALFDTNFRISSRSDRMGLALEGRKFPASSLGQLASVPVFPGCIQCPEDGTPYLLGVDAQTTGGYPRVAQVARVDRHVLGQLRAGDHLRLLRRTPQQAAADLRQKLEYWSKWLPDIESVI
jgi:biotin-dependent carboxylase-like uncharacterized protein